GQTLGCPPGETLVVEGQQASCVPVQQSCARDEAWDGRMCRKLGQCPPGSTCDLPANSCVKCTTGDQNEDTVDLSTCVRTAGGAGVSGFCSAFSKHPVAFGVNPGGSIRARIGVQVQVPGGEIGKAQVATMGIVEASGQPIFPKGAAEVQQAAQGILGTLVSGG